MECLYKWRITDVIIEGHTDADIIGAEGGDLLLPALVFGAGAVMQGIYSVGQALDNNRYWSDYYKNTGFRPRYPWRAGQYNWLQSMGSTFTDAGFAYTYGRRAYRNYRYGRYW